MLDLFMGELDMFVYLGGVPGVGKTTIIKEISVVAQKNGLPLEILEERKILCGFSNAKEQRDYFMLSEENKSMARQAMNCYLYEKDCKDSDVVRIRDDHFVYFRPDKTVFLRPFDKEIRQIIAFIVLIASPKIILKRRLNDTLIRPDRVMVLNDIIHHQDLEVEQAKLQSQKYNIPLLIIENKEGDIQSISRSIVSFVF